MSVGEEWDHICTQLGLTDPAARQALVEACEEFTAETGQLIITQGARDKAVYLLLTGRVRVGVLSLSGADIWVSYLEPGALFGEMAVLTDEPRSTEITADRESRLARLEGRAFLELLATHGQLGLALSRMLAKRMNKTTRRMFELSALTTTGRIYAELLRLSEPVEGSEARRISPVPNFKEMGDRISAARETVSRTVQGLSRKGILSRDDDSIVLVDPERLRRLEDTM